MLLVLIGVWRLWDHPDASSGIWLALGALALLGAEIWAPMYVARTAEWDSAIVRPGRQILHPWLMAIGLALSVGIDSVIFFTTPVDMSDWVLLALWFVSMLLLLAALLPAPNWDRVRSSLTLPSDVGVLVRSEPFWLVLIVAFAAATRVIAPTLIYPVGGDEGYNRAIAQFFVGSSTPNLFGLDYLDNSFISYVPQHLFYAVFGDGLAQARLSVALMGFTLVPIAYLLAREMAGRRVAVVTALIVAVEPIYLRFSRLNLPQVPAVLFTAVFLLCLLRGLRTGKLVWWVAAGMATGLALYGHTDARFIPFMALALLLYELSRAPRALLSQWSHIGWFCLAVVLGYGPTFFYVIHQPSAWGAHTAGMNIVTNGWLSTQVDTVGLLPTLGSQIYTYSVPILSASTVSDLFFPGGAFLPVGAALFAVAGVISCAVRPFQRAPFVLLSWTAIVFVLGGLVVSPPYQSQHFIELTVPLAVFTAIGIEWATAFRPRLQPTLALALAGILTVGGLYYFFVVYQPIPARFDLPAYKNDTMTEVGYFVHNVRPDATIYMFDDDQVSYGASPQAAWLAGDRKDVVDISPTAPPPSLHKGRAGAVFLFLPQYSDKLAAVKAEFPGGRTSTLFGRYMPDRPLAFVYTVGHPLRAG